jgi:hypothetical protein
MKTPILFFSAGAVSGVLAMWLIQSSGAAGSGGKPDGKSVATGIRSSSEEKDKLLARVQTLEKELKQAKGNKAEKAEEKIAAAAAAVPAKMVSFDEGKMEEMMKKGAERDVSREVDRLALRLKLSPEQKESLRKFLLARKEQERATVKAAMSGGNVRDALKPKESREDFMKSLLTPEQQADYARSQEERRTAKAEEYAQRKVRKLNNDLNLSEDQKDKFFQAYAQQKMTVNDAAKKEAGGDAAAKSGTIAFTTVGGSLDGGPLEFEFDSDALMPGANRSDLDRSTVESILTPEQLAVYDQRKAEEAEQAKNNMFHFEETDGAGITKSLGIRIGGSEAAPAKDK